MPCWYLLMPLTVKGKAMSQLHPFLNGPEQIPLPFHLLGGSPKHTPNPDQMWDSTQSTLTMPGQQIAL